MIKKLTISFLVAFLFVFAFSVHAQTNTSNSNQGIKECMKLATGKKKDSFKTVKDTYLAKVQAAKGNGDKVAVKQARKEYKQAKKSVKQTFVTDRKACKVLRPIKTEDKEVKVALAALNNSGVSGEAKIEKKDGKTEVKINLLGVVSGAVAMPAHIHSGTCASTGEVKYPLTSVVNGTSETNLNVTFEQLKSMLPLVINVHKSDAEANVYVACGEIKL